MEHQGGAEREAAIEQLVSRVEGFEGLPEGEQEQLRAMARSMEARGMNGPFIRTALRSTVRVMGDLRREEELAQEVFGRAEVRRFLEEHPAAATTTPARPPVRREWKQLERERLLSHTQSLVQLARRARAPHEAKKLRNRLLKIDQRYLRRVLGRDAEELCRQINGLIHGMRVP